MAYFTPVLNPTPGLRGYQAPMPNPMMRYRNTRRVVFPTAARNPMRGGFGLLYGGMGQAPVDIGTSATVTVTPETTTITPTGGAPIMVPTPGGGSLTDLLNANSSTFLWVGGVALGILLLSRMAR